MNEPTRSFAMTSDEALVALIAKARDRLVVIAPALTQTVGDATIKLGDLDRISMRPSSISIRKSTGFGDAEALEAVRKASGQHLFDRREQSCETTPTTTCQIALTVC